MFKKARIKLTAWYLLIIMLISIIFSMVIYTVINQEYSRIERFQKLRQERILRRMDLDDLHIAEARIRLQAILILVNVGVLVVSGFAGYFLAGRTLKPIKEMIDEQNRFITDASHELRTPITSLKTEIEVNLRDKGLSKETKKILESNLEEVNNLQVLSDNLIRLAGYQKGNGSVFEKISLKEITGDAIKKVANLAKQKHITIKNNVTDLEVEGDKQSLSEAFIIFLENAVKYSHQHTSITLTSKVIDHSVVVDIKDEGVGIAEEDMLHLFERFYRADKSRTKIEVQGYGLGLAIAKQIIDKHDGQIKVKSKQGKGTTFSIQLPIKHSTKY